MRKKALLLLPLLHQDCVKPTDKLDELIEKCVERVRFAFGSPFPQIALVLGSGFEPVTSAFKVEAELPFGALPGFPVPRVDGHSGRLLLGRVGGLPMLICCGRAHYYEGLAMETVMFPIRALAACGTKELIVTNAAGGINPDYRPGDFMLISDHINFTGVNPLRGLFAGESERFLDLTEAYSARLRRRFRAAAERSQVTLREGVYLGVSGPSYETPAEIRAFRQLGADAVGMSTIPEVLMARFCGLEVAGLSCITNHAAGTGNTRLSHAEVLATGRQSAQQAVRLIEAYAEDSGGALKEVKTVKSFEKPAKGI